MKYQAVAAKVLMPIYQQLGISTFFSLINIKIIQLRICFAKLKLPDKKKLYCLWTVALKDPVPRVLVKIWIGTVSLFPVCCEANRLYSWLLLCMFLPVFSWILENKSIYIHFQLSSIIRKILGFWILQKLHYSSWFELIFEVFLLTFLEGMGNLFLVTYE